MPRSPCLVYMRPPCCASSTLVPATRSPQPSEPIACRPLLPVASTMPTPMPRSHCIQCVHDCPSAPVPNELVIPWSPRSSPMSSPCMPVASRLQLACFACPLVLPTRRHASSVPHILAAARRHDTPCLCPRGLPMTAVLHTPRQAPSFAATSCGSVPRCILLMPTSSLCPPAPFALPRLPVRATDIC